MATETLPSVLAGEGWDDFLELETKIQHVADALQLARAERDQVRQEGLAALRAAQANESKLQRALAEAEHELVALRKERIEVRQRLMRLGKQLEAAGA
ncbi:MAG TPA: hypothetical protein VN690_09480 [Terriglobales bacterium]|nr:hypothetical protein [Terriglobales bacterium]